MQTVIKESRSRLQNKENYQRWGKILYNDKWVTHQEDTEILNMYTSKNSCKICEEEKLKGERNKSKIIVGVFNISLSAINSTTRQKIR